MNKKIIRSLLPYQLSVIKGKLLVHWLNPEHLDLRDGFFRDSIAVLPQNHKHAAITSLQSLQASQRQPSLVEHCKGLIFHCSRCGSTLLCQMLKQHPALLVIGEAAIFGQILRLPTLDRQQKIMALSGIINAYLSWARGLQKQVIFKLSSWQLQNWELFAAVLPLTAKLLLYREPLAVVESLRRHPPTWLLQSETSPTDTLLSTKLSIHGKAQLSRSRVKDPVFLHACYAYERFANQALQIVSEPDFLLLDYLDLFDSLSSILNYFNLNSSAELLALMHARQSFAAKQGLNGHCRGRDPAYQPRPLEELQVVKDKLGDILAPLETQYRQLTRVTHR